MHASVPLQFSFLFEPMHGVCTLLLLMPIIILFAVSHVFEQLRAIEDVYLVPCLSPKHPLVLTRYQPFRPYPYRRLSRAPRNALTFERTGTGLLGRGTETVPVPKPEPKPKPGLGL